MAFQMNEIPIGDPKVAEVMVRCLRKCGHAFDEALIETQSMMSEPDWKILRRGVGQVLGSDMFEMWTAIVRQHPQFERAAFGEEGDNTR